MKLTRMSYRGVPLSVNADSGRDEMIEVRVHGRQGGKSAALDQIVQKALDDGVTVYDGRTGETRGAGVAKDITPKERR